MVAEKAAKEKMAVIRSFGLREEIAHDRIFFLGCLVLTSILHRRSNSIAKIPLIFFWLLLFGKIEKKAKTWGGEKP